MHPDIFTPGTYPILVLLGLTIDAPLTVKHIFEDNLITTGLHFASREKVTFLRDVEITKVNKWAPKCPNCGTKKTFVLSEFSKGPPIENEVF